MVIRCTILSYYFMPYSIMVYFNNHFGLLVITIFFFLLVMLLWFVDSEVAEAALKGNKVVEECEVEIRPNRVPASCLDENVCLISVQKYFSPDAWGAVCNVVDTIRKHPVWYCGRCTKAICDETENSIVCESCLTWFHFHCMSLKQRPKCKEWFCRGCF